MSREEKAKVSYIVLCAFLFAKQHGLSPQESIRFLLDYRGIAFLDEHYEIEHTLPMDDTLDALAAICVRNGGQLA